MIESKIRNISGKVSRSSIFLSRSLLDSNRIERNLEKKSLVLKSKLVEQRGRTLAGIASRSRETQKGGILGGALGLLISGGGLLRRKLKTPKSPSQLLRMQKGTSNLSRAGRLGKLARPLAVVGTGLDFVGRRAEGQTNLQAGVGAGSGLAGAIGGAKIGAAIGTAILPGAGTAIGGLGGSIIGGLVGGNLADILTGANRRRQFEVQRTVLRTQKTLFSRALDDFDDVLDNFEKIPIGFDKKRRNEEIEARRRGRPRFRLPKIRLKNFFQRPVVQATGFTLLAAGLTTVAVLTRGKSLPASQKVIEKALIKAPFLKKLSEKEQLAAIGRLLMRDLSKSSQQKVRMNTSPFLDKLGRFTPGKKGAPGKIKKKTNIVKRNLREKERMRKEIEKAEKVLKEMPDAKIRLQDVKDTSKLIRDFIRTGELPGKQSSAELKRSINLVFDLIKDLSESGMVPADQLKAVKLLKRLLQRKLFRIENPKFNKKPVRGFTPKIEKKDFELLDDLLEIFETTPLDDLKNLMGSRPEDQKLDPLDTTGSSNIALAPMGNIFLLGGNTNNQQQQSPPIINDQNDIGMTPVTFSPYSAVAQQIIFESSLTA